MLIRSFAVITAQIVLAAFAILAFSAAAEAQFLTFVAATGVDTRPCTFQVEPPQRDHGRSTSRSPSMVAGIR